MSESVEVRRGWPEISVGLRAAIERIVALERRVAELEAERKPKEPDEPDYTCPICETDLGDLGCGHSPREALAAANRNIRELEAENDRFREITSGSVPLVRHAHREALESAAKMLEEEANNLPFCNWGSGPALARHAADLIRNHKVKP